MSRQLVPPREAGASLARVILALPFIAVALGGGVVFFLSLSAYTTGGSRDEAVNWAILGLAAGLVAGGVALALLRGGGGGTPVEIVGVARGVHLRNEADAALRMWTVYSLRVEPQGASGAGQAPVAVELRGLKIVGSISEGDWVEVRGKAREGHTVEVQELINRTTAAKVEAQGPSNTASVVAIVIVLVVLAVAAFLCVTLAGIGR